MTKKLKENEDLEPKLSKRLEENIKGRSNRGEVMKIGEITFYI